MNELRFDENLAIREVLDDIIEMVDRRERLIKSASQEAERSRDERMLQHVRQLEGLMSDFLTLFDPILTKIRKYGEGLRDSIADSERFLKSLVGIIDAGKSVEGTSATLQELEKDAEGVQDQLQLSSEALSKVEDLLRRTKAYSRQPTETRPENAPDAVAHEIQRREQRTVRSHNSGSYFLPGSRLFPDQSSKSQH
jgi:GTP1/Obg family GTP-binding protein